MTSVKNATRCLLALTVVVVCAWPTQTKAQQQPSDAPPIPAAKEPLPLMSGPNQNDPEGQPSGMEADQSPITGAQQLTLGTPELGHSYWVPGFSYHSVFQSNVNQTNDWVSASYFLGTSSLNLQTKRSKLGVNYSGGGSVSDSNTLPNSSYHQLSFSERLDLARWTVLFLDQFAYLPQSAFGFGGTSGISTPGIGGGLAAGFPGLQFNYAPGQSLFSAVGPQINNSFVTQIEYALTPRASLTTAGSYGLLSFTQSPGAIDTRDVIGSLGYDYQLTKWDTLGMLYRFTAYQYLGASQRLEDHSVNFAYGRKLTGRLALQLTGGPEVTTYRQPIAGATQRVTGSGGATLRYGFERGSLSVNYTHGLSGGSGIMVGSDVDRVEARFSNRLGRRWDGNIGAGFARNGALPGASGADASPIHSLFVSGGISRNLGRTASFSVNYIFDYQNATQPVCPAGGCGTDYTQHQIWMGFQWRTLPFVIR